VYVPGPRPDASPLAPGSVPDDTKVPFAALTLNM
jgi:hypothetical protein